MPAHVFPSSSWSPQVLALWLDLFRDSGLDRALEAGSAAGQLALFHITRHVFGNASDGRGAQLFYLMRSGMYA